MLGRIVKNISNTYTVLADKNYECKARGKFRNLNITPLVGDIVEFDNQNNYILDIKPRINELDRPKVANIDYALIVCSIKKPDLSLYLLDKEISSIIINNIIPIICFTKLDLCNNEELENIKEIKEYYENIGIKVFQNDKINELIKFLNKKYVVLTGQTGSGKSTLLNKIGNLNIETKEISNALGRGVHTTRHTEFYLIKDIYFADTPGFSSLDLSKYSKEIIRDSFKEFNDVTCEYRNCMHDKEQNCEVKKLVNNNTIRKSRYLNYLEFIRK